MEPPTDNLLPAPPCAAPRLYGRAVWGATFVLIQLVLALIVVTTYCWYETRQILNAALTGAAVVAVLGAGAGLAVLAGRAARDARAFRGERAVLGAILLLALTLRLGAVLGIPYRPGADFQVYHEAGVTMAETWTLGVESGCEDVAYRCFFPPGQVFSLGVLYALFGPHVLAGQLLNAFYGAATVAGVWLLGRRLFGPRAALAAALLAALAPSSILGCLLIGAEVPETFWLVAALAFYTNVFQSRRPWRSAVACGACLGVGALIRPTFLLLWIPLGLHLLIVHRRARAAALAALLALATAAVVAPWTARNYFVTGGFLVVSSNGGGNLYSANNDDADGAYTEQAWVLLFDRCRDDLSLHRTGMTLAKDWIRAHPAQFARLALRKFVRFWRSDHEIAWWAMAQPWQDSDSPRWPWERAYAAQAVSTGFYAALFALAGAGVWLHRRRLAACGAWMMIPILAAYFSAVHMVFESQGKYHFMLVPLICVLSALAIDPRRPAAEAKE
ncbi:MAG TPA: hypothetical protein DCX07_09430 [Phycisphaerales bacterium]|nr:hypothetical protein [Phycisphaerales bacterium]